MTKLLKVLFLILSIIFLAIIGYFFIGSVPEQKNITWGINFSQMQAENLGLNWRKVYLAILKDLGAKNVKLHTQWDFVEGKRDNFYFNDIDWQIQQAKNYDAKLIYVVGMKTGRWPECHLPEWSKTISKQDQQQELLNYITQIVQRYKNQAAITYWQVENEPLFNFGECPWYDKDFLKQEVQLVKSLDPTRQVIISDSGELSPWVEAASVSDILGVTLYRKVWVHITDSYGFYWDSIFPPISYFRRAQIVHALFGKKVIGVELQAEPWTIKPFFDVPLSEQEKSMNLNQFRENINFAKKTGLNTFYLWGTEWWYWMKEKQGKSEMWDEAKKLFINK